MSKKKSSLVKKQWEDFWKKTNLGDRTVKDHMQSRRDFYCGYHACLSYITNKLSQMEEDKACEIIDNMVLEVHEFFMDLKEGKV